MIFGNNTYKLQVNILYNSYQHLFKWDIKYITMIVLLLYWYFNASIKKVLELTIFIAPFSASFYILNMWVLHILRLFLVKYCFFNHLEETFKLFVNLLISPCQILPTAEKICDVIVSRVHTWWFDSYDVLNEFEMK